MSEIICQSCAMPMKPEDYGTNKDGSPNAEYCRYCYGNGAFTSEETMEEMIATCVHYITKDDATKSEAEVRAGLEAILPKLKRWAQ